MKEIKEKTYRIEVKQEKQVESAPRTSNSRRGWINFGQKNDYPLQLSNLYYNSPTHKACIDFAVTAIIGDGVDYDAMMIDGTQTVPNYQETWDSFLQKLALDYKLFGSYAFQIIKNKDGRTYSFYHQPVSDVRCSPRDEDGVITSYWISSDWSALQKYPPVELPAFGFQEDEKVSQGKAYLFVSSSYSPDLEYYQLPPYASALKAIQTEIEVQRYDLRSVVNNFSASGILTINRIDSDEERKAIIENIEAMFQGSDNANSLLINFKDNDEDVPVTFTRLDKDVNSVNLFGDTNERTIARILSAHRIPSKQLIGYDAETSMLGGEGNLLNVAFNLYNKTVASHDRKCIVGTVNKMLRLNGIEVELVLKPLSFNITETQDSSSQSSTVSPSPSPSFSDSGNVEEKQTNNN